MVFYEFCKAATYTHEIMEPLEGGSWSFLHSGPWKKQSSHRYVPARPRQRLAAGSRRVLAGGEVAGGEGPVW
jgi:hypothetical protein